MHGAAAMEAEGAHPAGGAERDVHLPVHSVAVAGAAGRRLVPHVWFGAVPVDGECELFHAVHDGAGRDVRGAGVFVVRARVRGSAFGGVRPRVGARRPVLVAAVASSRRTRRLSRAARRGGGATSAERSFIITPVLHALAAVDGVPRPRRTAPERLHPRLGCAPAFRARPFENFVVARHAVRAHGPRNRRQLPPRAGLRSDRRVVLAQAVAHAAETRVRFERRRQGRRRRRPGPPRPQGLRHFWERVAALSVE
mmetsp:Transcript_20135/g.62272  ORF Transcript_20135/g.62272 Transcript_20135/m.62272 type:complete len:253 (-) Transcript_20135:624-1382(-)